MNDTGPPIPGLTVEGDEPPGSGSSLCKGPEAGERRQRGAKGLSGREKGSRARLQGQELDVF